MAKRPPASRSGRGDNPFVKLSGRLADFLGVKASSGRYVAREALTPINDAFELWKAAGDAADTALDDASRLLREQLRLQSVSNRQRATQSLRNRTGEPTLTREKHARQIKSGERQYASNRSRHLQQRVPQGYREVERKPRNKSGETSGTKRLIVVQPGGTFADVTVRGSDIAKIKVRNEAMAAANPMRKDQFGNPIQPNPKPLERFMRRYKRHYVRDAETGERVDLIMSREDLDASKAQMNTAIRDEVDKRYAEDMAEA